MDKFTMEGIKINLQVVRTNKEVKEELLKYKEEIAAITEVASKLARARTAVLSGTKNADLIDNLIIYAANCIRNYQLEKALEDNPRFNKRNLN